jgi:hypothetical protein
MLEGLEMIIRLDNLLCRVMLHKHMMWAWRFWWIEAARVGTDCTSYVRIGFKAPRIDNTKYM